MPLIRPRLNDYHGIPIQQESADFAIPFLDEDIPLYVDPFLLWKSPSQQDQALHTSLINSFNHLVHLCNKSKELEAQAVLVTASECAEVGLGTSKSRTGQKISSKTAQELTSAFKNIPQLARSGFVHFEEIQLYVDGVAKDRISDYACSFLKSFLIDYTIEQCRKYAIPTAKTLIDNVYDYRKSKFIAEVVEVPINPQSGRPLLLVPKRWLRFHPWIGFDDYFDNHFAKNNKEPSERVAVLTYNRANYDLVTKYVESKAALSRDCRNDPLFTAIPITSAKRKMADVLALPSGKAGNADKKYEDLVVQLLTSFLYPELDFAKDQARTDSGVLIRDLIFYNNRNFGFLEEIWAKFKSQQIVFELKNVAAVERDHINQLNRYMNDQLGGFGVIVTRNPLPKPIFKNTIDLWAGQRKCIIVLTDTDLEMMTEIFDTKQRKPLEVLNKKYVEFTRACPS